MSQDFTAFLDELGGYVDDNLAKLPPSLARPDVAIPMHTLLRMIDGLPNDGQPMTGLSATVPAPSDPEAPSP